MKIGFYNIDPKEDVKTIRRFLLDYGKSSTQVFDITIPPNMQDWFKSNFANKYWDECAYGWKKPDWVTGEFCFAFTEDGVLDRTLSWGELVGQRFSGVVCGIVELSVHCGVQTLVVEERGYFNEIHFGRYSFERYHG